MNPQDRETVWGENVGTVQYKRATPCSLKIVLTHAQPRLSAAYRWYESDFDRKVSLRPVASAGSFVFVYRPPRALTIAERIDSGRLAGDTIHASRELVRRSEGLFCVRSAADMVIYIVRDGITVSVSTGRVTKAPTGPRTMQSSAAAGGGAESQASIKEPTTGVGATVQDRTGTGSIREDDEEYVIDKLTGHNCAETGMQ